MIPLEDTYADVLGKACRGLGLSLSEAARRAGIPETLAQATADGTFNEAAARSLAGVLGLQPDRLAALGKGEYHPEAVHLEGLKQYNTPFQDMTVNSFLIWDAATKRAVAFDTGTDCDGMLETLRAEGLTLELILLTHSHGDHIYDLDRLKEKTHAPAWIGEKELVDGARGFAAGKTFALGNLTIETRSTWGHSRGGITYVVSGLSKPVAVVGDALFAGSMGGGGVSYDAALKTNREALFTLPDETVVCPGHGPLTTIGEQKKANPFSPEY